jgi:hypothetical protein
MMGYRVTIYEAWLDFELEQITITFGTSWMSANVVNVYEPAWTSSVLTERERAQV